MGDITGFLKYNRKTATRRPVEIRKKDYNEVYNEMDDSELSVQGARCMDCGIPFCHEGCPLGNLIPEWNDFVYKGEWELAFERLHATNNFPDFTGRLCPAPCEGSCVLGINAEPVSIKQIELSIVEHGVKDDTFPPIIASLRTGKKVAIVGSGPSGLAAAQQLARAGHDVDVFERQEKPGGLLRYGIPEFKMEKHVLDRRIDQMTKEGVNFICSSIVVNVKSEQAENAQSGFDEVRISDLENNYDAVILTIGSTVARDLNLNGRKYNGTFLAMEYLKESNLFCEGTKAKPTISAKGKNVIIIGGGDTGADCLGTAIRQEAKSIMQLEIMSEPPKTRAPENPWPTWPIILRTSSAHEEGGQRLFSVTATEYLSDDGENLSGIEIVQVEQITQGNTVSFNQLPESKRILKAEMVLLAMGFVGPDLKLMEGYSGISKNDRGSISVDQNWFAGGKNVFAAGDAVRGQSLIVWAIAEGRSVAASVDRFLMNGSKLPSVLKPYSYALR